VVSDANVRVLPSYLRDLVGALLRPGVGVVSSLVVGSGERTIGASLENAQLGAFIAPSIVCSSIVGRAITVGKSMAMRRTDLEGLGGFRSFGGVLAEDDVLGQRFREKGYAVELCFHAVHNRNVNCSVGRSIERHTRWAKMRRAIAPRCFPFELLLTPMLMAFAVLCMVPSATALRALCAAWALQCVGVTTAMRILRGKWPSWQIVALEPLRALVLFACWLRAWTSRRVEWRGNSFRVGPGTELIPITMDAPASGRVPL
jgi:ceramide glucosyltransferase